MLSPEMSSDKGSNGLSGLAASFWVGEVVLVVVLMH